MGEGKKMKGKVGITLRPGDKIECVTIIGTVVRYLYIGKHDKKNICYKYYSSHEGWEKSRNDKSERYKEYSVWNPINDKFRTIRLIKQNPVQLEASRSMSKKRLKAYKKWVK